MQTSTSPARIQYKWLTNKPSTTKHATTTLQSQFPKSVRIIFVSCVDMYVKLACTAIHNTYYMVVICLEEDVCGHSFQISNNKIVNDDKSRQRQSRFCLQYLEYPPECDRGWGKVAAVINWYQTQPSWNYNFHLQTGARHQLITWRSSVQVIANCKIAKILTVVTVAIYLFVANIFIYIFLFFMVGPSQACQAKR